MPPRRPDHTATVAVVGLYLIGLVWMLLRPKKTADLVLGRRGWYDDELDRRDRERTPS